MYLLTLLFLPRLGDELQLPKVMTDTDTVASVSTDAGVLKRARSRHYLNGKSRRVNTKYMYMATKLDLRFRGCELQFSIENFYAKPWQLMAISAQSWRTSSALTWIKNTHTPSFDFTFSQWRFIFTRHLQCFTLRLAYQSRGVIGWGEQGVEHNQLG